MVVWVYALAVILFVLIFRYSRFLKSCDEALIIALDAIEVVLDRNLDDQGKGELTRKAAIHMLRKFSVLSAKSVLIFLVTIAPIWLADSLGFVTYQAAAAFALRADVLLITTLAAVAIWYVWRQVRTQKTPKHQMNAFGQYSHFDRMVHDLAFGSNTLIKTLISIERRFYSNLWSDISPRRPIFVSSLPRAGTTILLEALHRLETVATHTYRDMPFVLVPVLWARVTARFQVHTIMRERSHGDGLRINEDSPEAFEEVLWTRFFPHKYRKNRIALWRQADARFTEFFSEHMQKIILLRHPKRGRATRYASKNNANIARIPALREMFPDAFFLVPFREPFEHTASLLRQHRNFSSQHMEEPFVRKYMSDIGHFEFGALHCPIYFETLEQLVAGLTPELPDYWLAYWIAAFEHLKRQQGVTFLSYETLVRSGAKGMNRVCDHLGIDVTERELELVASMFRDPRENANPRHSFREDLSREATRIYQELQQRCILQRSL